MTPFARLRERVLAWVADDPDPATRDELARILAATDAGDPAAATDLEDRFDGLLQFGTAGLRGPLGAGPNRMNRAVVIRAAAGLTAYLQVECAVAEPMVVVGFDARHGSDVFARDTASVVVGAGGRAVVLPRPLPTPVLAFAIRHVGADAGVMVTASHNPRQDNGYKVYLGDGSQIVPPVDALIASHIEAVLSVRDLVLAEDGWETLGDEVHEEYVRRVAALARPDGPRDLAVVHTALHGVGGDTVRRVFLAAGFPEPVGVATQSEPDPDFPTVVFPNPEEPGALDAALEVARQAEPDVVIANDPDADRCAVAVADRGRWRMLRGDEVGALLGAHLLSRGVERDAVFASSIVSSRLLSVMAAAAGVRHVETLTGFKWIARVPGLVYGYEEALGYCVAPEVVRDKDGVSAALLLAELAAGLTAQGRTLLDLLDDLAVEHGVYATDAFSVRFPAVGRIGTAMDRLRAAPPQEVAGVAVRRWDDLARGAAGLPPTEGVRWFLGDGSRIVVRPSGTEPKLKVYLEAVEAVRPVEPVEPVGPLGGRGALAEARATAAHRLAAMHTAMEALTAG